MTDRTEPKLNITIPANALTLPTTHPLIQAVAKYRRAAAAQRRAWRVWGKTQPTRGHEPADALELALERAAAAEATAAQLAALLESEGVDLKSIKSAI
jgi:hypothetical protein